MVCPGFFRGHKKENFLILKGLAARKARKTKLI